MARVTFLVTNTFPSTVVNISDVQLSPTEVTLLSKGLTFCPTPPKLDTFQLQNDLDNFHRRLRLKEFFYDSEDSDEEAYQPTPFRQKKRKWTPPKNREPALESYIQTVTENVKKSTCHKRRIKDNLTREERATLKSLRCRVLAGEIVIKPADKGSATVVMSQEDYVTEAMRQLNREDHYLRLDKNPTTQFADEISKLLIDMKNRNSIDQETKDYLTPLHTRTARFYLLPKIHKPGNPGRPIVSSCGAPTERISHFVDHHLHPHVQTLPSFIKDTTDFLNKLQTLNNIPKDTLLVTLDVSSLYTNIPHQEGIEACREALNSRTTKQPPTEDLAELIKQILTKNNFEFGDSHFLQIHGTAMGTRMAPSYANIFMGKLEKELLAHSRKKPTVWWRYIDDVFALWTHGEESLNNFIGEINQAHPTIKFTAEWSKESVSFLDTTVKLEDGQLVTDLFVKPTDTHQYLAANSCQQLPSKTLQGSHTLQPSPPDEAHLLIR